MQLGNVPQEGAVWSRVGVGSLEWSQFLSHRKIMDSGELDFYQHAKVCSNTCRSTKIDLVGNKVTGDPSADLLPATPSTDCEFSCC